uniref:ADP,ATP carrier protein n=1 Tax=Arundo donax TaxID=35708 RepID=A0A0A9G8L8_ARUDO
MAKSAAATLAGDLLGLSSSFRLSGPAASAAITNTLHSGRGRDRRRAGIPFAWPWRSPLWTRLN